MCGTRKKKNNANWHGMGMSKKIRRGENTVCLRPSGEPPPHAFAKPKQGAPKKWMKGPNWEVFGGLDRRHKRWPEGPCTKIAAGRKGGPAKKRNGRWESDMPPARGMQGAGRVW